MILKAKYQKTLKLLFARPVSANISWKEIEALLKALGAKIEEREGSRVGVSFEGKVPRVFHRPHPKPDTDKGAVAAIRKWLEEMKFSPKDLK